VDKTFLEEWKHQEKLWKYIDWMTVTLDTLVSATPGYVFALGIISNGDGDADAIAYDEHSALGDHYIPLATLDELMFWVTFTVPVFFRKGIFIDIGTNVQAVIVQYLPVKE